MIRDTDVLIVGAGPTGLGATWRLSQVGHEGWALCEGAAEAGGLAGSEIDYVDDLIGASCKINNPNAKSSCGCGTSFSP